MMNVREARRKFLLMVLTRSVVIMFQEERKFLSVVLTRSAVVDDERA